MIICNQCGKKIKSNEFDKHIRLHEISYIEKTFAQGKK